MRKIEIEGTAKTPFVKFEENGQLELKGRSIPENSIEFYEPMVSWLEEYATNPQEKTVLHVQLEYFNTSSSKCILDVFKKLEAIKKAGHDVVIKWYYEEDDEDMLEAGEDYQTIISVPFEMIEAEL
jgi:hypothetical protein